MLSRLDPFAEFLRFADTPAWPNRLAKREAWAPAVDIEEDPERFVLSIDLPGVKSDDVHLDVHDDTLTVSGERRASREVKKDGVVRSERFFGRFSRTFTLPNTVDTSKIEAAMNDGVLEVHVPKKGELKPRRIPVGSRVS